MKLAVLTLRLTCSTPLAPPPSTHTLLAGLVLSLPKVTLQPGWRLATTTTTDWELRLTTRWRSTSTRSPPSRWCLRQYSTSATCMNMDWGCKWCVVLCLCSTCLCFLYCNVMERCILSHSSHHSTPPTGLPPGQASVRQSSWDQSRCWGGCGVGLDEDEPRAVFQTAGTGQTIMRRECFRIPQIL